MHIIVALITVSFAMLYRERLRYIARWRQPAGRTLIDDELRLARLRLPSGWRAARDLNEGASLQAINPLHGRHVIVISEALEDYALEVTVHEHARITLDLLTRGIKVTNITGPHHRVISGREAVQYEIEGFHDNTWVTYLHTTIAGRRAFHQIIGWATQSRYSREVFEALLEGFGELPGPDPIRWPAPSGLATDLLPSVSSRIH
jgi:dihydrofolate reductase